MRYVDDRRKFALVDMTHPLHVSVLVPAAVVNDFGMVPVKGMRCELGDVCQVPRGWQASRILKLYPLKG